MENIFTKNRNIRQNRWGTVAWAIFWTMTLAGCSTTQKPYEEKPLETLCQKAVQTLKQEDFEEAADHFDEIERQYPYAAWAAKAQILSAYCAYKAQKFSRAIATLDVFISLHPASPLIAYAYYLRALSYYTNISPVLRDRENADLALEALNDVVRRFPDTDYAQDAAFKRDFILEHLASQEITVGKMYLAKKKFLAAMKQFSTMITHYPCSQLMPEALYRLMETQISLGLFQSAQKTFAMICHNFPKNTWTLKGRTLLQKYLQKK